MVCGWVRNIASSLGLCLLAITPLGCGEESIRYPVAGTVLVDGERLPTGSIRFVPAKGRPVTSAIRSDGTFELAETSLSPDLTQQGVPAGRYRVAVTASRVIDEDAGEVEWLAPSKYADFRSSGIAVEIDGPRDELIIDLTSEVDEVVDSVEHPIAKADATDRGVAEQEGPLK